MLKPDPADPIVVTGMGAVSPLGVGVDTLWRGLVTGRSGIVHNASIRATSSAILLVWCRAR